MGADDDPSDLSHQSSSKSMGAEGFGLEKPWCNGGFIHDLDIGILFKQLDPVEFVARRHKKHGKLVLTFRPAVGELAWKTNGGLPASEKFNGPHVFFFPPGVEHSFQWKTRASAAVFFLSSRFLRQLGPYDRQSRAVFIRDLASAQGGDSLMRHLSSMFETLCKERLGFQDNAFVISAGRLLMHRIFAGGAAALQRLRRNGFLSAIQQRRVTDFMEANMHRSIRVQEMAQAAFLSEAHLTRLFTCTYGDPPVRYHLIRRLRQAEADLLRTDCTILDVVAKFGFGEQSYFNRAFLKYLKYRPGALLRLRNKPKT
jgi:AraC-like DNA-binding protein